MITLIKILVILALVFVGIAAAVGIASSVIHRQERKKGMFTIAGFYRGSRRSFIAKLNRETGKPELFEIRVGDDGVKMQRMGCPTSASIDTRQKVHAGRGGNKGVVMGAAVGNAIAGRAGAVIGAMNARENNRKSKTTYHKDLIVYFDHDDDEYMRIQDIDEVYARHVVLFINKASGAVK